MIRRRTFLGCVGTGVAGALAGCQGITSPDPSVVETDHETGIKSFVGIVEFRLTVLNEGPAGDVEVTLSLLDEDETVLKKVVEEVNMERDERREVRIETEVPEGTSEYRGEANPL